jgi:hypothetical protein
MKRYTLLFGTVSLALLAALRGVAQDTGYWTASSSNAKAITGDLSLSDARVTINLANFPIAQIRKLEPSEAGAVFDVDSNVGGGGNLYRLSVPPEKRFLHHNTLCGTDETQWMATYVEGRTLHVAFFSGDDMPVLTLDALAKSSDLCGTFSYVR